VASRDRLYRAHMGSRHEVEIRASVDAHQDLRPAYDDAVAEGLVERIGAEIDKRIDARLGLVGRQWASAYQAPWYRAAPKYQTPPAYCQAPAPQSPPRFRRGPYIKDRL